MPELAKFIAALAPFFSGVLRPAAQTMQQRMLELTTILDHACRCTRLDTCDGKHVELVELRKTTSPADR